MPERLTDIFENFKVHEKADTKLCEVIAHLIKLVRNWKNDRDNIDALAKKDNQIIILDPLNPDLEEIISKITNENR